MIGYPSGQDGAILPARETSRVPQGTFIMFWCFIPYNKSFIDQACSVKMAGYWPRSSVLSIRAGSWPKQPATDQSLAGYFRHILLLILVRNLK